MASGKSHSRWDNTSFLRELVLAFHDIAAETGGLSQEKKDQVVQILANNGFNMTWNALRITLWTGEILSHLPIPHFQKQAASSESGLLLAPAYSLLTSYFTRYAMAPVQRWDEKVHESVLIAILDGVTFTKEQWSVIMSILRGQGYTFTEGALRQHIAKLRRNRDNTGAGSAPVTPSKPSATKAIGKRAASGSGRKKSAAPPVKSPDEDDSDELVLKSEYKEEDADLDHMNVEDTPSKRLKADAELFANIGREDEA